jgi:lipoate-protein ligase B
LIPFLDAYALQRETVARVQSRTGPDTLYLLEHPHVVTKGRNAGDNSLIAGTELLEHRNVTLVETDRGGDVTYHGPGQLVGYPIIELEEGRRDIRRYVSDIEEVLIRALGTFSISARRDTSNRGVWVDDRKIASVGIRISRWVTSHGFALNANTDLSFFSLIVPCGIEGCRMTSIAQEIGSKADMDRVKSAVVDAFAGVFGREPLISNNTRKFGHA